MHVKMVARTGFLLHKIADIQEQDLKLPQTNNKQHLKLDVVDRVI